MNIYIKSVLNPSTPGRVGLRITNWCSSCACFGYTKENGDQVCKYGLNFNFKTNRYDNGKAARCKDFKEAR